MWKIEWVTQGKNDEIILPDHNLIDLETELSRFEDLGVNTEEIRVVTPENVSLSYKQAIETIRFLMKRKEKTPEVDIDIALSLREFDRYEFINAIIGWIGHPSIYQHILGCSIERLNELIQDSSEAFEDEIARKMSQMSVAEMNELSNRFDMNCKIIELEG